MKPFDRRSIVLVLLALNPASASAMRAQTIQPPAAGAQTQATPTKAETPATAVIRGRVLASDTGQPVRRASVHLNSAERPANGPFENRFATTDADGAYEFRELAAGRYVIGAQKGAYVSMAFGQSSARDAPKPIDLLAGEVMQRVDISLPRGGVITGRVIDEFGEPLSNAQVTIVRSRAGRMLPAGRAATTNDLGEFRLFGLMPGQYYLRASYRPQAGPISQDPDHVGYGLTYYPGVADERGARRVTVVAGQAFTDIVFAMIPVTTATISGHIVDSHGKSFSGSLMLMPQAGMTVGGFTSGAPIRPDGTFAMANVVPGDYVIRTQGNGESAMTPLSVAGVDISGIEVVTAPPSTITGRVSADAGTLQALAGATLSVMAVPAPPGLPMGPMMPGKVSDDLTFTVKASAGRVMLQLSGLPNGVGLRAARLGGVDVTDAGIEIRTGADVKDLEIDITNRLSTVTGAATDSRGDPIKDYTAIVFAQDAGRWKPGSRYMKFGRADSDGHFKIVGLPPGDYYGVALNQVDVGSWNSPETLEPLRSQATMFSLDEGETKTLDLRIVAGGMK